MAEQKIQCATCTEKQKVCKTKKGKGASFCPTLREHPAISKAQKMYKNPAIREWAKKASIQEGQCYANRGSGGACPHPVKTRVQEVCEFAHKMGYKKVGIAFCEGLHQEASLLQDILEKQGFEVISVVCKVGRIPKEEIGIKETEKIRPGEFESMCSPIAQALLLNEEGTEFNILVGLCVGHDSLFLQYSTAPCTVLVVKDRVTGHNPAAAVYTSNGYYRMLSEKKFGKGGPVKQIQSH